MNDANAERMSPFACDMNAIEASRRGQHVATIDELFHTVTEIRELPDGYSFRRKEHGERHVAHVE